jgi:outer membrane immunogenic protein
MEEASMAIMRALMWAVAAAAISVPGAANAQPRERLPCCEDALDYNWSGVFVGGHAAVAISNLDLSLTPADSAEHSDTAFGGGLQVAFQRQWGRMVAGVEVSYTWVDLSDSNASVVSAGTTFTSSISDLLVVAGKLGYAQDRFLAFAKAGYASAEVELRCSACGAGGVGASTSDREHGWMMGIGIDYAVTDKIIVGVEYNWLFLDVDQRVLGTSTADASSDVQTLMARLMFKFGGH